MQEHLITAQETLVIADHFIHVPKRYQNNKTPARVWI
jgi:hypothetical protein